VILLAFLLGHDNEQTLDCIGEIHEFVDKCIDNADFKILFQEKSVPVVSPIFVADAVGGRALTKQKFCFVCDVDRGAHCSERNRLSLEPDIAEQGV
jgi:hypothetical protein